MGGGSERNKKKGYILSHLRIFPELVFFSMTLVNLLIFPPHDSTGSWCSCKCRSGSEWYPLPLHLVNEREDRVFHDVALLPVDRSKDMAREGGQRFLYMISIAASLPAPVTVVDVICSLVIDKCMSTDDMVAWSWSARVLNQMRHH